MTLKTERLLLEPLRSRHARLLFRGLTDPVLYRFIPQDPPKTIGDLREMYHRWVLGAPTYRREIWLNWALRLRRRNVYIGTIQATVQMENGTADIAYGLMRKFWHKGYAREACARMIEFLVDRHRVQIVRATMDTRNEASVRLARSLGLKRRRLVRKVDFFKGSSSDEYLFESKLVSIPKSPESSKRRSM